MLIPLHLIPIPADEPAGLGDPGHAWRGANSGLKIAAGLHLGDIRELGLSVSGPTTGGVQSADLMRFGQLMANAGIPLQPPITALTGNVKLHLVNQKTKLDQELLENENNQPVPLLEESAKRLEGKTTWLKIPREKIPSFKQLQSWSLGATLYILNTWWLMLIIYLLVFRLLWKLWRSATRRADDGH
jgi:hypothetical protein